MTFKLLIEIIITLNFYIHDLKISSPSANRYMSLTKQNLAYCRKRYKSPSNITALKDHINNINHSFNFENTHILTKLENNTGIKMNYAIQNN